MRPLRLELEGFTAFREPTTIDFDGADLFVLCGPTGAGKSSLIDAMSFALYGSVSRYKDPKLVHPVISQGKLEARVRFDFTVSGRPYTAVRVVQRTKTGATTREARLESGGAVLAGKVHELDTRIRELFGLSFDQFTTCVVLPQGEFARFLHDTPAGRQELLKELLGLRVYDRMRQLASAREAAARQRVARLEGQLEPSSGATAESRRELERRCSLLRRLQRAVEAAQAETDRLEAEERQQHELATRQEREAEVLGRLRAPQDVERLGREQADAGAALRGKHEARAAVEKRLDIAEQKRRALPDAEPLRRLVETHLARDERYRQLAEAEKREAGSRREHARAEERRCQAAERTREAQERREAIVRANAAHHLAAGIAPGDPCPVCLRPVERRPRHRKPPGLDEAQAAVIAAESARQAIETEVQRALRTHAEDATRLGALRCELAELDRTLHETPSRPQLERQLKAIAEAERKVEQARAALRDEERAERQARTRLEELAGRMHAAWTEYDRQRDALGALAPPATDRADLTASWKGLVAWAAALAAQRREEAVSARTAAAGTARSRETKLAAMRAACEEAGVERLPGVPRDAVVRALADAETRLAAAREAQEEAQRLRARLRVEQSDQAVARALASHLSAPCFERWLLQEAFDRLVAAGSERLRELSSGDYSFRVDERVNFEIVDHRNADESRSARTLSGGETFLASLALALALADQVSELATEGACPLDSIFLDEGFGTLDPDALDTVAATIEDLGARGRTVGLVTHVRELADRIPVQYRITKGPASAVVERVLA